MLMYIYVYTIINIFIHIIYIYIYTTVGMLNHWVEHIVSGLLSLD